MPKTKPARWQSLCFCASRGPASLVDDIVAMNSYIIAHRTPCSGGVVASFTPQLAAGALLLRITGRLHVDVCALDGVVKRGADSLWCRYVTRLALKLAARWRCKSQRNVSMTIRTASLSDYCTASKIEELCKSWVPRASRLKIAGDLKIDLAGTSRRSMRDRCTIMIDANTDEPDLTHQQPSKSSMLLSVAKWN